MNFYILKKKDELIAIPADEQRYKQYLDAGYFYIDKVAACNESMALKLLRNKYQRTMRLPLILTAIAVPLLVLGWWLFSR